MQLGAFSISLAVKDLKASQAFYEKLGFKEFGGDGKHYLMMKNGETVLGLFQGMFEKNILTFNPGWNQSAERLKDYSDIRELQAALKKEGMTFAQEAEEGTGPASFVLEDPDGNPVLVDQHVPAPGVEG